MNIEWANTSVNPFHRCFSYLLIPWLLCLIMTVFPRCLCCHLSWWYIQVYFATYHVYFQDVVYLCHFEDGFPRYCLCCQLSWCYFQDVVYIAIFHDGISCILSMMSHFMMVFPECLCCHFSRLITFGVCVSKISLRAITANICFVHFSGSYSGLSLLMNVEQYEHIEGLTEESGIKIYLHDQNEIPAVRNLGITLPTGMHSMLAVRHSIVSGIICLCFCVLFVIDSLHWERKVEIIVPCT